MLLAQEGGRDWSLLSGSFARKQVKGVDYVYFQYSDPGGAKRQFSVGRSGDAIDAIIAEYEQGRARHAADLEQVSRLAGLLRAAGLTMVPHGPARVIRALADAGLFAVGGVLVGSYAFQALGNLDKAMRDVLAGAQKGRVEAAARAALESAVASALLASGA